MPLIGTEQLAAQAEKAARHAVQASWVAKNRVLSQDEIEQMKLEVRAAEIGALFAHITANAIVAGTATGAMAGGPGVPVIGTVT